jgi:hypothetical protein
MHIRPQISLRWIVVSYFIIAGVLFAFHLCSSVLTERGNSALFGTYGVAGLLGGFLAGRASRSKTVFEPAFGSLLVVLSLYLFDMVVDLGTFAQELDSPDVPISQALIAFAAAVAGSKLGERLQPKKIPDSNAWWGGLTALTVIGSCFMVGVLAGSVLELFDSGFFGFIGVVLIISTPVIGGAVAQIAAPFPIAAKTPFMAIYWSIGVTTLLMLENPSSDAFFVFFGTLIAGLIFSTLAAAGAASVCKWAPHWQEDEGTELTAARAREVD